MVFLTFTADQISMSHFCTLEAQMSVWQSGYYALLSKFNDTYQGAWPPLNFTMSVRLRLILLRSTIKQKDGRAGRALSAWRHHTGRQRAHQHPAMPWRAFSLSWVPMCSSCLTWTSYVRRERGGKCPEIKKIRQIIHPKTKLKTTQPSNQKTPRRYHLA